MGSLKALQEWCRMQCEDYNDVDVKNMSTSFRDGLAFCAIIHRFRPDIIDFSSLSKENVYENNRLAFEVAEAQLGIPALLDPEDMVSMNVPDRLSVITYVSQYYNYFTNKSHVNPPTTKRPAGSGQGEPAQKRLMAPLEDKALGSEPAQTGSESDPALRRGTLSSTCTACHKHVHLVQRFLVEGRLYHRHCFRCRECSSTLLPGAYKMGKEAGSLVCTHHFARPALANQNGRPDLSTRPVEVQSARIGRSPSHQAPPSESDRETTPPPVVAADDQNAVTSNSLAEDTPTSTGQSDSLITEEEPSVPPNPFAESDDDDGEEQEEEEEAKEEKEEIQTPAKEPSHEACQADRPPAPAVPPGGVTRPVPAPRRVPEATPPPRPAPRVRPHHTPDRQEIAGVRQKPVLPPKPRERSHSPGSQSIDTPKSKDPPWLALVQSEPKKKPAPPPPPPAGLATPPRADSLSSLRAGGSRPSTPPPPPANPFDDDDEDGDGGGDDAGKGGEEEGGAVPAGVAASHPWYRITQAAEAGGAETTPPSGGSSSRSSSPGGGRGRKRPAPRAPQPPSADPVPPYSLPSSCSPSPALSVESLSYASDQGSTPAAPRPDLPVTKSASEPSISAFPAPTSTCPEEPHLSLSPSPPAVPANTSSAPATPQTNRSEEGRGPRHPPPRPPTSATTPEAPAANGKRTCKENPFNRKPSPAHGSTKARPPRGPRPARPPAPGHGFPLIKRKVQSDQYVPPEDIHGEMNQLEEQLDQLEQRGVELESKLRDNPNDDEEEQLLVEWFTLIHDKHLLVRREAELVYTSKQQGLEERQGDVEYELRCLLNKPEKDWSEGDRSREQELMADLVTIIEQRNQIINNMDQDRQRDEEEDKLMAAMLKKKDFHKEPDGEEEKEKKKKKAKFKPMKVLKRLSHKGDPSKTPSPHKDKS